MLYSDNYIGVISKYSEEGKKLISMGEEALNMLISGLDEVKQENKGYLAITISNLLEEKASKAVPKIIEYFPINPKEEIGINIKKPKDEDEIYKLRQKYGQGRLVSQSSGGTRIIYFYSIDAPAAVAALFNITRECPGITKESWKSWLKLQK